MNSNWIVKSIAALAVGCVLLSLAHAAPGDHGLAPHADGTGCDAVLQTTETYSAADFYTKLALLDLIDDKTYDQAKHDAGIVAALPAGLFEGDYGDFSERRHEYHSLYSVDYTHASAETQIARYLPANVTAAWTACKQREFDETLGLQARATSVSASQVTISLRWNAPPNSGARTATDSLQLIGGDQVQLRRLRAPWRANETRRVTFRRLPAGAAFVLNISVGGFAQGVEVAAESGPAPPALATVTIECGNFQSNARANAHEDGQQPDPARAGPNTTWVNLPFGGPGSQPWNTSVNANRSYAAVFPAGQCDTATPTPLSGKAAIRLSETVLITAPGAAPYWWGNAHWSPIWKSKFTLPSNGTQKSYSVVFNFSETANPQIDLPKCNLNVDGDTRTLDNGVINLPQQFVLAPGEHLVGLECPRDRENINWNENLTLLIAATRS